jgi:hypothetical protein
VQVSDPQLAEQIFALGAEDEASHRR